jgi:hypothetical protein
VSTPPAAPADQVPAPGSIRCPRCDAPIGPDQDWCLECGAPARTRLARTPNWRLPVAAVALIALIAGIALAGAFVALTNDSPVTAGTQPATTAGATAPPPSVAVAPTNAAPTTAAQTAAQTPADATPAAPGATSTPATGQTQP